MNKILVVAKNPKTYFIKRLIEEVGERELSIYNPWEESPPLGFTHVIVRTSGVYRSEADLEFLKDCSTSPLNSLESHLIFRSKSSQYAFFTRFNHPSLQWWWLEEWQEDEDKLYLVKPDFGQGGWGIRVMNSQDLSRWREEQRKVRDLSWIVQPFVKAPEYRIFFMGDERITLKRIPEPNRITANFSQEGEASLVDLPTHLRPVVDRLINNSGAYYGAIDLLDLPAGPVFLELNVVPGVEQLEKITGINILGALLTANYFCQIP